MTVELSARDRAMTRRVLAGETCRSVGSRYGLSPVRVNQIVQNMARQLAGWQRVSLEDRVRLLQHTLVDWRQWYQNNPHVFDAPEGGSP